MTSGSRTCFTAALRPKDEVQPHTKTPKSRCPTHVSEPPLLSMGIYTQYTGSLASCFPPPQADTNAWWAGKLSADELSIAQIPPWKALGLQKKTRESPARSRQVRACRNCASTDHDQSNPEAQAFMRHTVLTQEAAMWRDYRWQCWQPTKAYDRTHQNSPYPGWHPQSALANGFLVSYCAPLGSSLGALPAMGLTGKPFSPP